jgi:isopenicillin-N epimerase
MGADFYGANCHKWLLAPTGSGFLYVGRPSHWQLLKPLQVSWGWKHNPASGPDYHDEFGSTPHIRHLEFEGTRDPCPWLAVAAAIDFQEEVGRKAIRARIDQLVQHVRARLGDALGLERVTPAQPHLRGAMTAFRLPAGLDPQELRRRLWEQHRIEVPIIERLDGLLVRVSTHFYNTEEEVDRLSDALRELLRGPKGPSPLYNTADAP